MAPPAASRFRAPSVQRDGLHAMLPCVTSTALQAAHLARHHRQRFVSELRDFVRFPSISAQPEHAADVRACAAWLADHLRQVGFARVDVVATPGHPLVYAEWRRLPNRPTLLVYGHYDVQPVDPVDDWRSPPFEPTVRGKDLFGRGASDDKGQLFAHVKAIESYLRASGGLPVNVKCLFEGEEEIGSPHLCAFLSRNRKALAADAAVISDMRILAPDRPALIYSLRGALGLEVGVVGPKHDLHSGSFGGAVHNPLEVLCGIIVRLHDGGGRVAVPGFYDRVRAWSREERDYMARVGPSDAEILRDAGTTHGWGERGFTLYERTTIRPSLTVSGISSGYEGAGPKAVIPSRALMKINVRLVPDQDPEEIERLIRRHIEQVTPPTARSCIRTQMRAKPALVDRTDPMLRAATAAYRKGFGVAPVFLRSGGTIPVVRLLQDVLRVPTVLMGFALPDDRMHAPNEKFHLPNFFSGIETCVWLLAFVGSHVDVVQRATP
jgi:acetylornithine deacetylase/succinyl-diaminopimelate desuccinylase-like protein